MQRSSAVRVGNSFKMRDRRIASLSNPTQGDIRGEFEPERYQSLSPNSRTCKVRDKRPRERGFLRPVACSCCHWEVVRMMAGTCSSHSTRPSFLVDNFSYPRGALRLSSRMTSSQEDRRFPLSQWPRNSAAEPPLFGDLSAIISVERIRMYPR